MSARLAEAINKVVFEEGNAGRSKLAIAAARSEQMIDRYRRQLALPSPHVARELALACGFTKDEALEIAEECASLKARDSA